MAAPRPSLLSGKNSQMKFFKAFLLTGLLGIGTAHAQFDSNPTYGTVTINTGINFNNGAAATTLNHLGAQAAIAAAIGQILGGPTTAGGQPVPITIGSGLALSNNTLTATGGGGGAVSSVVGQTGDVTSAQIYSALNGTSTGTLYDGALGAAAATAAANAQPKIAAGSGSLLGAPATLGGTPPAITIGSGLLLSGSTLTAPGGGSGVSSVVGQTGAVTASQLYTALHGTAAGTLYDGAAGAAATATANAAQVAIPAASGQILGGPTSLGGNPVPLTLGTNLSITGSTLNAAGGGGGTPGGTTGQLQYNNAGSFAGLAPGEAAQTALASLVGSHKFYASNYGVLANGNSLTDISTVSGSADVASASYTFVAGDVGKEFALWDASPGTQPTSTFVSGSTAVTVSSAASLLFFDTLVNTGSTAYVPVGDYITSINLVTNTIQLSEPAIASGSAVTTVSYGAIFNGTISSIATTGCPGSVSNCAVLSSAAGITTASGTTRGTFGSDDTVAYRNLVTTVSNAGGGTIVMPVGISMVRSEINWLSHVNLEGAGRANSTLFWTSPNPMGSGAAAVIWNSAGTATVPIVDMTMANFGINLQAATANSGTTFLASCMSIAYNKNWYLTGLLLQGSPRTCIRNDYPYNFLFTDNVMRVSGNNGIGALLPETAAYPSSSIISDNFFFDPSHSAILYENLTSSQNSLNDTVDIIGNHISWDGYTPPSINNTFQPTGIDVAGVYDSTIVGNVLRGPISNTGDGYTYPVTGITVGMGDGANTDTLLTPSLYVNVSGNTVYGLGDGYSLMDPGSQHILFEDNISSDAGYAGFQILGSNTNTATWSDIGFVGNMETHANGSGINIDNLSQPISNIRILNNSFENNGGGSTYPSFVRSGVSFGDGTTNQTAGIAGLNLSGNDIFGDANSGSQIHGLGFGLTVSVTRAVFQHNDIQGNASGPWFFFTDAASSLTGLISDNGLSPTFSVTGATAPVGQESNGQFAASTTGSNTVTVTPNASAFFLASHGWSCGNPIDETTPSDSWTFTGSTTSTIGFSGTAVSGDIILFGPCKPY